MKNLGFLRTLFLMLLFGFLQFLIAQAEAIHIVVILALLFTLIAGMHSYRGDEKLLLNLLEFPVGYYVFEYAVIIALVSIGVLFSAQPQFWFIGIFLGSLISFLPTKIEIDNTGFSIPLPFSKTAFEWKAGMRNGGVWGLVIGFAVTFLGVLRFELLIVGLFLMNLSIVGFFKFNEPRALLYAISDSPVGLLTQKIHTSFKIYFILNVPYLLIGLVFYTSLFYILVYLFIVTAIIIMLAILMKYASYEPETASFANSTLLGFYYICLFIPFLLPIPLLVSIRTWKRASKQLSFFY
ncbi:hypothetical protein [Flammeovirga kamogawensis]|uniref:EI24 domain-containing protein n=1 Tax=Flammeovirga kamogawensis TaxID=373891 RepID=A0ABX8GUX3_9BACT|nr:hypothetical protein [Flammeovirga kamogawensis]MBB6462523.1 hypothetical protein [Flammeovirga kamogawensis]QWG06740.1 hypothetical protein KM029_15730 [Flammeovirga kamogawensis]TRX68563.1 hypothetical protein EO216_10725 [Flammeovirga kamogawensis]